MAQATPAGVGSGSGGAEALSLAGLTKMYDFSGKSVAITGGAGILGAEIAGALAGCGAQVAILDVNPDAGKAAVEQMGERGNNVVVFQCDVLSKDSVMKVAEDVVARFGKIDCLVNGAGGNKPAATTNPDLKFFDLPADALRWVFDLNILGTILPSQAFGKVMAAQGYGSILNISSMNAFRPLTRIPAYSAAKAAVSNFTQWMAVHFSKVGVRVNAIAPGFFITDQNRALLTKTDGSLTPRANTIIAHTPMGKFGAPEDLLGALLWLTSDTAAGFVTGVVIPIDGGFAAFSGV